MNVANLLIVWLTEGVYDADAVLITSSKSLAWKHEQKVPPATVRTFHGNMAYKSCEGNLDDPIGSGSVGMYLVAHGAFNGGKTKIAGRDPAEAAEVIHLLLTALKVSPANFKKLSLDVCNAATTKKTSDMNRERLRQAQAQKAKIKDLTKEVRDNSALSILCKELGTKKTPGPWTPLIAGWDGYVSVAGLGVGSPYVYFDEQGKALRPKEIPPLELQKEVGEKAVSRNIGKKVHSATLMVDAKPIHPHKMLVKDLVKDPTETPNYADSQTPVRSAQYKEHHKFVLQYVSGKVTDIKIDAYHGAI